MNNHFTVNDVDGTISLHYENLNPAQVEVLIAKLKSNVQILKLRPANPIQVLKQSVRLDRAQQKITFQLNWDAPVLTIDLEIKNIPHPNVEVTPAQYDEYISLLMAMMNGV